MGYIEAICISEKKGEVKIPLDEVEFIENWGIKDDAHGGKWHRQVSLLAGESIDGVKEKMPQLEQGAFAENIITRGIKLKKIRIGEKLRINKNILLQVTQIGKECHSACAIKKQTGDCIMPREGIFARVLQGGNVKNGDRIRIVADN